MTVTKITRTCQLCEQAFEAPIFAGVPIGIFCPSCRQNRLNQEESDRQNRQVESLKYQRGLWLADPQRGVPARYRDFEWSDFEYPLTDRVEEWRNYAEQFPVEHSPKKVPSLLLTREVNGVGKTMLACLILKTIINRFSQMARERSPFQFWTVGRIKRRLQSAERYGSQETVEQVYQDYATMWLLVLDDVGKEKLAGVDAAWTYEMYHNIFNERYNNQLPIIVTSNLSYEPWTSDGLSLVDLIGRGGVSRLMEMTGGKAYVIEGEERR